MATSSSENALENNCSSNDSSSLSSATAAAGCESISTNMSNHAQTASSSFAVTSTYSPISVDDLIQMATGTHISNSSEENTPSSLTSLDSKSHSSLRDAQYFSEVIPNLFLTSANHITDENIAKFKITHIVNATRTVPLKRQVKSLRINVSF